RRPPAALRQGAQAQTLLRRAGVDTGADIRALRQRSRAAALRLLALPGEPPARRLRLQRRPPPRYRALTGSGRQGVTVNGEAMWAPIAVIGAGSWGTALAQTMAVAGRRVRLVARDPGLAA